MLTPFDIYGSCHINLLEWKHMTIFRALMHTQNIDFEGKCKVQIDEKDFPYICNVKCICINKSV